MSLVGFEAVEGVAAVETARHLSPPLERVDLGRRPFANVVPNGRGQFVDALGVMSVEQCGDSFLVEGIVGHAVVQDQTRPVGAGRVNPVFRKSDPLSLVSLLYTYSVSYLVVWPVSQNMCEVDKR